MTTLATKAVAGLAAAAIVTAGAAEVKHVAQKKDRTAPAATLAAVVPQPAPAAPQTAIPVPVRSTPQPIAEAPRRQERAERTQDPQPAAVERKVKAVPVVAGDEDRAPNTEQHDGDTSTLPTHTTGSAEEGDGSLGPGAYQPSEPAQGSQPPPAEPQPSSGPPPEQTAKPAPTPEPTPEPTTLPAEPTPEPTPEPAPTPEPEPTPVPDPVPGG